MTRGRGVTVVVTVEAVSETVEVAVDVCVEAVSETVEVAVDVCVEAVLVIW